MKGQGRRTRLEMEVIYTDVEDHLVRMPEGRIKGMLIAKYGVDQSTVGKWIREVYTRLRKKNDDANLHEDRRNLMRMNLDTLKSMAINKSVVLRTPDGKPIMDPTDPKKPMRVAAPDLKHALAASEQLRKLDGLDAPVRVENTNTTKVTTEVTLNAEDRTAIERALKGLA